MKSVTFTAEFSSAHFYNQPQFSAEKNREVFGRCYTEYGHGHNYTLRAEFEVREQTDLAKIHGILKGIISRIDHEHLNFVIPEFKDKIPTSEVILEYLRNGISQAIDEKILNLELFETANIGSRLV